MERGAERYYKREFWAAENVKYSELHFRLDKAAALVNTIAQGKKCDLLDVGCGPATLRRLLKPNVRYYGVDIAIHSMAPDLLQADFLEMPIAFDNMQFDIIVAQGVFEYVGRFQLQKLREIGHLLKNGGVVLLSYVNFDHHAVYVYPPYNNVQPFGEFQQSVARVFQIDRIVPTSHQWHHHEPNRRIMKAIQMRINFNIPLISRLLAVEYFLVCSPRPAIRSLEGEKPQGATVVNIGGE